VNLITAPGSKGLEYDRVFVVGVEDGLWPHKNAEDWRKRKGSSTWRPPGRKNILTILLKNQDL
jgi:superfamily I DNA/RNA helicase